MICLRSIVAVDDPELQGWAYNSSWSCQSEWGRRTKDQQKKKGGCRHRTRHISNMRLMYWDDCDSLGQQMTYSHPKLQHLGQTWLSSRKKIKRKGKRMRGEKKEEKEEVGKNRNRGISTVFTLLLCPWFPWYMDYFKQADQVKNSTRLAKLSLPIWVFQISGEPVMKNVWRWP